MKAILNHKIYDWDEIRLSTDNRGFKYGDGFFETIAIIKGQPRLLKSHIDRLIAGSEILKLSTSELLILDKIEEDIHALQKANDIYHDAKLRLTIWRNSGGLYVPDSGETHMLMTIERIKIMKVSTIRHADFSDTVTNFPSAISRFKTLSAMKYVLGGIEKQEKKLDELILLDYKGNISESLSSNIFWKTNYTYYTPPLSTGCIEGIMRNWFMSELKAKGYSMEEKLAKTDEILEADCIFATNALGIRHVNEIRGHSFRMDPIAQDIIQTVS